MGSRRKDRVLLYLVRHGETDWNLQRRIQGRTDIPLNDTGKAQAAASADLLARRPWDGIYTSPLSRAAETAGIIARRIGLSMPDTDERLVERNYGEAEGLSFAEIEARFPGDTVVPGREERHAVAERVLPVLLRLAADHPEQNLIIVSHGGVIRAVLNEIDPDTVHPAITNGSIHSLAYEAGTFKLIEFDDPIELEAEALGSDDIDEQNAIEGANR
jgi:probable phosphoglycerate mutase